MLIEGLTDNVQQPITRTADGALEVSVVDGITISDVTIANIEISNDVGNPVPVTGPLTDTQLRATPLPVSVSDVHVDTDVVPRTPTTTSVASSATSVTILAANANRRGVSIANLSTAYLYLSFSTPATTANSFMRLDPGMFMLLDQQMIVTGAIYGIWAAANGTAQVTEYV